MESFLLGGYSYSIVLNIVEIKNLSLSEVLQVVAKSVSNPKIHWWFETDFAKKNENCFASGAMCFFVSI